MATSEVLAAPRGGVRRPVGVMGAAARPAQRQRTRACGRAAEAERLTAEWRGPELMAQPERWMLTLSEEHIRELDAVVERSRDLRLTETTASDFEMPTFARELRRVKVRAELQRRHGAKGACTALLTCASAAALCAQSELLMGGPGIALLRGVPVDRYTVEETVRAYWAMMVSLGDVDPVPQNAKGHMLGHVYDLGGDASDPNTRIFTTSAAQPMHTDSADIVGLLCLAEAVSGGESQVVSSTAVYREVQRRAPELARELTRPFVWSRKGEVRESASAPRPPAFIRLFPSTRCARTQLQKQLTHAPSPALRCRQGVSLGLRCQSSPRWVATCAPFTTDRS